MSENKFESKGVLKMKRTVVCYLTISLLAAGAAMAAEQKPTVPSHPGTVTGADSKAAGAIIGKKCTTCHSKDRIDAALSVGKDMKSIQRDMEKRGAVLNPNERDVLGIYWGKAQPLKKK
jgi:uncharacterized membrane protein